MFVRLLVFSVAFQQTYQTESENVCNGTTINGVYHEKEILTEDYYKIYSIAADHGKNALFFSHNESPNQIINIGRYDFTNKKFQDVFEIIDGFSLAVDQKTHELYVGTVDGVYKFDHAAHKLEHIDILTSFDQHIGTNMIYFKDKLYYTDFRSGLLHTYENGNSNKLWDLKDEIIRFTIDNDNNVFYYNQAGIYSYNLVTKETTVYKDFTEDIKITKNVNAYVKGVKADMKGEIYVCLPDGVYKINKSTHVMDKEINIPDAIDLTFDAFDNIIYTNGTNLIRMVPRKDKQC